MVSDDRRVLIAGGGPVGLLCASLLGRQGVPVCLFDENAAPQADPRAVGGMGVNGGVQDAANLCDKLLKVLDGAPDRLLDLYERQRRTVAVEFVQEQSIANKKRREARDPDMRRRNVEDLRATAADPIRARQFLLRTSMIASQRRAAAMTVEEV